MNIPPLPEPTDVNSVEAPCPWCGADFNLFDNREPQMEEDCMDCHKPVRWDFEENMLYPQRTEKDMRYLKGYY